MKKNLLMTFICLLAVSCNSNTPIFETGNNNCEIQINTNSDLKAEFSKALAKVFAESKDVRELIRNEALKKINYDYDVLYQLVKDINLSNGMTLETLVLKYVDAKTYTEILKEHPTLTIFIPELPENSFSAEIWDTDNEIPYVCSREFHENGIPIYDSTGKVFTLEGDEIPAFPIVVVKDNERITVKTTENSTRGLRSVSHDNYQFVFADNIFDNTNQKFENKLRSAPYDTAITVVDPRNASTHEYPVPENRRKILDSYDIYNGISGWQRDYIYYNLTTTKTEAPFDYKFKEHIVGFEMVGDAMKCINKISDQPNDPRPNSKIGDRLYAGRRNRIPYVSWTDGEFEFKVKVYLGNKGGFGSELITFFRASPYDMFKFTLDRNCGGRGNSHCIYKVIGVENKIIHLLTPLFEWNLENYSANIKISIEEVDATETIKQTATTSTEFATNFSYSATFGETVKNGLQFGASAKETRITSYEISTTHGNDELGEVIVNFWDDIIISRKITPREWHRDLPDEGVLDYNKKYSTGWYRLYVAPIKTN